MGIMRCAHLHCPFLHTVSDLIGYAQVELGAELHRREDCFICLWGDIGTHLLQVKNVLSEIFRDRSVLLVEASGLMCSSLV